VDLCPLRIQHLPVPPEICARIIRISLYPIELGIYPAKVLAAPADYYEVTINDT
jgi:hypothetical protein